MKKQKHTRGFTLLLAALVSSIVLAMGASIYSLASKEVTLSSLGRDSQFAFFAADQAAECALYWDIRFDYFATSSPSNVVAPNPQCDGQTLKAPDGSDLSSQRPTGPTYYPYTISFVYSPGASGGTGLCANVSVAKSIDAQGVIQTIIHADGFSTACITKTTDPRSLQRSVELHY